VPSKNILISFLIGCSLAPIALLLEKGISLNTLILNNENLGILMWSTIEEVLKIISLFLFIKFNKNSKNSFIELLGIGIGFSFIESISFSYNNSLGLFSGVLNTGLLTLVLRSMGSLILHTFTIGLVSFGILYLKKYKINLKYFIFILLAIITHFFFNFFVVKDGGNNFLNVFLVMWILFLVLYLVYLYFDYKKDSLLTIKKFKKKVAIFIGKFLLFIIFIITFVILIEDGVGGFKNYSEKDIEQAKIIQTEVIKVRESWNIENLPEEYRKYHNEIESIVDKLTIINNHYEQIIFIAEEGDNFSGDDLKFLRTNGGELKKEVDSLMDEVSMKARIDYLELTIKTLKKVNNDFDSFFNKFGYKFNAKDELTKLEVIINDFVNMSENLISMHNSKTISSRDEFDSYFEKIYLIKDGINPQIGILNDLIEKYY
jgi:hypothetical protein